MQHCYWRNMQPEVFTIKPTAKEQEQYSSAILEGYVHMDKLIERVLKLAGPDATVVFATAISQQPYLKFEDKGGKRIYRPKDIPAFAAWAGIQNLKASNPVMAEQFWLEFHNHDEVNAAARPSRSHHRGRRTRFRRHPRRDRPLHRLQHPQGRSPADAVMTNAVTGVSAKFFDIFYAIEGLKSGMHHQDGLLWIRDPRISKSSNPRVAVESIAPTILELLEVAIPAHLKDPSLLKTCVEEPEVGAVGA